MLLQLNFQLQHLVGKFLKHHQIFYKIYYLLVIRYYNIYYPIYPTIFINQLIYILYKASLQQMTGLTGNISTFLNIIIIVNMQHQKYDRKMYEPSEFWCHFCHQQFISHLRAGIDQIICPRCSNDFCQLFSSQTRPNNFIPYQKPLKPKNRRLPRITTQAVLVALSQYAEDATAEKVREITEQDIIKLRIRIDRAEQQCLICKDQFQYGNEALRCPCGHVFHIQCLSEWMEYKNTCPKCRNTILPQFNR